MAEAVRVPLHKDDTKILNTEMTDFDERKDNSTQMNIEKEEEEDENEKETEFKDDPDEWNDNARKEEGQLIPEIKVEEVEPEMADIFFKKEEDDGEPENLEIASDGVEDEQVTSVREEGGGILKAIKKAATKIVDAAAEQIDGLRTPARPADRNLKPMMDFLKATRYGDSRKMEKILKNNPELDINTRDMMGNSPLILAVRNDHPEVVRRLLSRVSNNALREALLLSISLDHHHISEFIIRHPRYQPTVSEDVGQATMKAEISEISLEASDDTLFATDITPLVLAAQRNQFEIVKLLLSMGEKIEEPHDYHCTCVHCRGAESFDELRFAKTRLNLYKGLASEAYISLSTDDPLLAAFELGHTLKKNAIIEKHFKGDYKKMSRQLSDYTVKLLDKVRDGEELDILLNETQGTPFGDLGKMARLKLAIRYEEKLFVTHASCQKKITHIWYGSSRYIQKLNFFIQIVIMLGFVVAYPVLAFLFWIYPWGKVGKFLSTPVIKFVADACSRLGFAALILYYTFSEKPSEGITLSQHPDMGPLYQDYIKECAVGDVEPAISDVFVRSDHIRVVTFVVTGFIIGYMWHLLKTMSLEKRHFFIDNGYNIMDLFMLTLYVASFTMRYLTTIRVGEAVDHFSKRSSWSDLYSSNGTLGDGYLYWLDADRYTWDEFDTFFLVEGTFALANLLCIIRTSYMMSASEVVGPLLISLKQMIKNVLNFMVIFLIVIVAFVVAFYSLYWYYNRDVRDEAEIPPRENTNAEQYFGRLLLIGRTVYFSLFGMMEPDVVELGGGYKELVTSTIGYFLFGAYNWITVIVLINMLIAMMARSYEFIDAEKDMEWKFDRTKLYLDYIKDGNVLCVPFNLVPTWFGFTECLDDISICCGLKDPSVKTRRDYEKQREKAKRKYVNEAYGLEEDDGADPKSAAAAVNSETGEDKSEKDEKDSPPAYQRVIFKVTQRFIIHSSAKNREGESGEMDPIGMFNSMKRDLSTFRFEMVKTLRRQDKDREKLHEELEGVETKLQSAKEDLVEVASACHTIEKLLSQDIKQGVSDGNVKLNSVDENVVSVRGDVSSHENNVSQKLRSLESKIVDSMSKFTPIMASLSDVQNRLRRLASDRETTSSATGLDRSRFVPMQTRDQ